MAIKRLLRTTKKTLYNISKKRQGFVCLKLLGQFDSNNKLKQRIAIVELSPKIVSSPEENITARISLTDLQEFVLRCNELYSIPTKKVFNNKEKQSFVHIENKELWRLNGKRLGYWKKRGHWNLFKDKKPKEAIENGI